MSSFSNPKNHGKDFPHGEILGMAHGVPGFASNYKTKIRNENDSYYHQLNGITTGYKWQCVEYARRFWLTHFNVALKDVGIAASIWGHKHANVMPPECNKIAPLEHYPNGCEVAPQIGDLLIYAQHYTEPVGHVAVIVEVGESFIRIAEQNRYNDRMWPGDFAFEIPMEIKNGKYVLTDHDTPSLIGWMRVSLDHIKDRPQNYRSVYDEML